MVSFENVGNREDFGEGEVGAYQEIGGPELVGILPGKWLCFLFLEFLSGFPGSVDRDQRIILQDLVGFNITFPLFFGLAVVNGLVDPWNQRSGKRCTELLLRETVAA